MTHLASHSTSAEANDLTPTDEELMVDLADGRQEALGALYSRHSPLVFYLALHSLGRPAAAVEITLEPAAGGQVPSAAVVLRWQPA
jgi:hypothetical protein